MGFLKEAYDFASNPEEWGLRQGIRKGLTAVGLDPDDAPYLADVVKNTKESEMTRGNVKISWFRSSFRQVSIKFQREGHDPFNVTARW